MADTIDIRKDLIHRIGNVYPITSNKVGDTPGVTTICSAVMTTYQNTYMLARTVTGPARALQDDIVNSFNSASHSTLKDINKEVNKLVANIPQIILPKTMDPRAAGMTSIFKEHCLDFQSFLPPALNMQISGLVESAKQLVADTGGFANDESFFQKSNMDIMDVIAETEYDIKSFMTFPGEMLNQVTGQVKHYKDVAMDAIFGKGNQTILVQAIRQYEEMMADFGIPQAIKTLQKIERCLMKPSFCNKKKKDLISEIGSKDILSVELTKVFNIDANGRLRLSKVLRFSDASKLRTMQNLKRKLDIYAKT